MDRYPERFHHVHEHYNLQITVIERQAAPEEWTTR